MVSDEGFEFTLAAASGQCKSSLAAQDALQHSPQPCPLGLNTASMLFF